MSVGMEQLSFIAAHLPNCPPDAQEDGWAKAGEEGQRVNVAFKERSELYLAAEIKTRMRDDRVTVPRRDINFFHAR